MTGRENCRFVCRIHGVRDYAEIENAVWEFSELGPKFDLPIKNLSSGQKARVAFGMSMVFDFDIYLLDEVTSVGDPAFRQKATAMLEERRKKAKIIMVSHSVAQLRQFGCDFGVVLSNGKMTSYDNIDEAYAVYGRL